MSNIKIDKRTYILFSLSIMVFFTFSFLLFKIQIIDNEKYVLLQNINLNKIQIVKSSRGEIIDRNGVIIASNKNGFDIVLNKAYINKNNEYNTILTVVNLLNKYDIESIDYLPIISKHSRLYFEKNKKNEIKTLKNFLSLDQNASLKKVWSKIIEKYKLKNYSLEKTRILAGIKYSMDIQGYSFSTPYTIAKNISMDKLIKLKESCQKIQGIEIVDNPIRDYILNNCAPHIIGNVGPIYAEEYENLKDKNYSFNDIIGKNGIEKYCEKYLRGTDGEKIININNKGTVNKIYNKTYPIPGNTVVLTIDSKLQYVAQQALEKQIKNLNKTAPKGQGREADSGAVVVLDVQTGEILAIASYPAYNINEYNKNFSQLVNDTKKPLFNRALLGTYAPGSCYKPVIAIAALQEGIVQPNTTVRCGHVYNFYSGYKPKCLGYHSNINVVDALRVSCNIYFYDVGRILGIDKINSYSSQLGFQKHTGIQLLENIGQLASPQLRKSKGEKWYPGDVLQASIGQSDNLATPLQLANYVATIANRGKRMKISIIKKIISYNKKTVLYNNTPRVVCNVDANSNVFETVIEGMTKASRVGTARRYFGNYPITVPSKTGTPQTSNLCNSTFICFAPDKNSKIAIAVVIEKGWHGYTGAPVAKEIIDSYFKIDSKIR